MESIDYGLLQQKKRFMPAVLSHCSLPAMSKARRIGGLF
jgi:hypothetical protein